jgi:hypothetical protein
MACSIGPKTATIKRAKHLMADEKRISGTKPLPTLEDNGGGERGEDPSSVTADWYGQEVVEAVDQAGDERQGLEDDLSRLLSRAPGPEPRGPQTAKDDVAYAPTQELGVLEDTAPKLPAAQAVGFLDDTAPTLPTAAEMGVPMELAPNASSGPRPAPSPPSSQGRVAEVCNEVVVFTEEQRQQVEQAIQRKETAPQALEPVPTDPVHVKEGGRGPLLLGLLIVGVVITTALIWVFYLT